MAAMAVVAELRYRDGLTEKVHVKVENSLSSLITGLHELNGNVSRILSELVERERERACAQGEEEEDSDEEDVESEGSPNCEVQPPAKRSKT